ncbi:MAG: ABC transporter substrate-binding protein [Paracoccaceae bacterium]
MKHNVLAGAVTAVGCILGIPAFAQGSVTTVLAADWDTLDPHLTKSTHGFQMALALYDRVVALDADGTIVPYLATSWEARPDGVTLQIGEGATCADGTPVDAAIVAASMARYADPATNAPYRGRTFGTGAATVTHDDAAQTVTIALETPNSDLMLSLAMPWSSVVCPAGLAAPEGMQAEPQGSGPFTLTESRRGDTYVMKRRDDRGWGPSLGELTGSPPETLTVRVSANTTTTANLFVTGEANVVSITGKDIERLAAEPSVDRQDITLFGSDGLMFAHMPGRVTNEPLVRRALSHAVDREGFNRAFAFGYGTVLDTLTTPSMQCYDASVGANTPGYDLARAEELLIEAGFARNSDGQWERDGAPLTIRVIGYGSQNAGPEFLMESWRQFGIDASLVMGEFGSWFETLQAMTDWDASIFPYNSSIPSPSLFVAQITGAPKPAGPNYQGEENPRYAEAARAALAAGPEDRCALWAAAEQILLDEADTLPLVARNVATFTRGVSVQMISGTVYEPNALRLAN